MKRRRLRHKHVWQPPRGLLHFYLSVEAMRDRKLALALAAHVSTDDSLLVPPAVQKKWLLEDEVSETSERAARKLLQKVYHRVGSRTAAGYWTIDRSVGGYLGAKRFRYVLATIKIDYPLTDATPKRLRERTFKVKSEAECMWAAASMYDRLYKENERAGGEAANSKVALARRMRRRRRGPRKYRLFENRGRNPYVWGHDLSDLVFETMRVRFSTPTKCVVTFGIGS